MQIVLKRLPKSLAKGWGVVLIALLTVGCEWGDRSITLVRPDTDNLQVVYTDTMTVLRSTVMKDSLYTAAGNILAGRYIDPRLGPIEAKGYLLPSAQSGISLQERAVYDSIALVTNYVYYYGDTTKRYQLSVYELQEDITTGPYFNKGAVAYDDVALGTASFFPRPRGNDSLRVKLSDGLGTRLFNDAKANRIKSQEDLLRLFKGVAFIAGDGYGSGFLGYSRERTVITMYYHVDGADGKARYAVNLTVGQFFNQVLNDRSGTAFESLTTSRDRLSSDQTSETTVVQSGVGLMTRLDFPFLHQFGFNMGKVIVNRAFLRVQLPRNPENPSMPPPGRIALYATGNNNDWEINTQEVASASFVNDSIHNERYYELDVSSLVMQMVQEKTKSPYGFLIGPLGPPTSSGSATTYTTTLDRLILPRNSVKLKVYYTALFDEE